MKVYITKFKIQASCGKNNVCKVHSEINQCYPTFSMAVPVDLIKIFKNRQCDILWVFLEQAIFELVIGTIFCRGAIQAVLLMF